jgi:hypothetical protein
VGKESYMKYLKNRKIAVRITSFIVLLSILLGAHLSLTKLRDEALQIFYSGEKMNGKGIQSDLEYIADQCYNLTVVAGRYMNKEDVIILEIIQNRDLLGNADTPGDKYQAKEKLIKSTMILYENLKSLNLNERDEYYNDSFPVNVESRQLIISHSSYNKNALTFNNILKKFPANILRWIIFMKPLDLYE